MMMVIGWCDIDAGDNDVDEGNSYIFPHYTSFMALKKMSMKYLLSLTMFKKNMQAKH